MIIGILINNIFTLPNRCYAGIIFSQKKILNIAIVLLGYQMSYASISTISNYTLLLIGLLPLIILITGIVIGKKMLLPPSTSRLIAIGTAICGSSAIAAAAPVIQAKQKDIAISIACVNLLGLLAVFALPLIGSHFKLSDQQFGVWSGISIQAVPQVIATGLSYSANAGNIATLIKLVRVCLLGPFLIVLRILTPQMNTTNKTAWYQLMPPFVIGFFIMMILRSVFQLDHIKIDHHSISIVQVSAITSHFLMAMALAAVGLKTHLTQLRRTGGRTFYHATSLFLLLVIISYFAIIQTHS